MSTTRVPVDRIKAEAANVDFARMALTAIGAVLYALGWLVAGAFITVTTAGRWCVAAVRIGWADQMARHHERQRVRR